MRASLVIAALIVIGNVTIPNYSFAGQKEDEVRAIQNLMEVPGDLSDQVEWRDFTGLTAPRAEVYEMIRKTYGPIGGVHQKSVEELKRYDHILVAFDKKSNKPVACFPIKRTPYGLKPVSTSQNGSPLGKEILRRSLLKMIRTPGLYIEVSKAVAAIVMKEKDPLIIPYDIAEKILREKNVRRLSAVEENQVVKDREIPAIPIALSNCYSRRFPLDDREIDLVKFMMGIPIDYSEELKAKKNIKVSPAEILSHL